MAAAKEPGVLQTVSVQTARLVPTVARVEIWYRIEKFNELMNTCRAGVSVWSDGVASPLMPQAVWKLQVYPKDSMNHVSYRVNLTGKMASQGESVDARCTIWLKKKLDYTLEEEGTSQSLQFQRGHYSHGICYDEHDHYLRRHIQEDGALLVVACIEVEVKGGGKWDYPPPTENNSMATMKRSHGLLVKMLDTEMHSDFIIVVGEERIKAHKVVLAASSPTFAVMLAEGSGYREAGEGVLRIEDFSPEQVRAMVDFIYGRDIDWAEYSNKNGGDGEIENTNNALVKKSELLGLADKYGLLELKAQMEHNLCEITCVQHLVEMAQLADAYVCPILLKACADYIADHFQAVIKSPEWGELMATNSQVAVQLMGMGWDVARGTSD